MAAAEPDGASIEALFRPSTRFRDLYPDDPLPAGWTEIELLPHLTPLDILATGTTWDEFRRFLLHKVVWMTPDVYLCNGYPNGIGHPMLHGIGHPVVLCIGVMAVGTPGMCVHATPDTAAAVLTATCDFVLRLFATCEQRDLYIDGAENSVSTPISGAGLSLFFSKRPEAVFAKSHSITLP
jgi:hypothetical protein